MEISGVEKYENESLVCQVDDGVSMGQCLGRYILGGNQLGREPCDQQVFKINREGGTKTNDIKSNSTNNANSKCSTNHNLTNAPADQASLHRDKAPSRNSNSAPNITNYITANASDDPE